MRITIQRVTWGLDCCGHDGGINAASAAETRASSKDEQEIRALHERMVVAVDAKHVEPVMKAYVRRDELFVFDMGES
jgi:hypothetical protein